MDIAIGFISIGIISLTNIILVAFYGGRISQRVEDHNHRIEFIEKKCFEARSKDCP